MLRFGAILLLASVGIGAYIGNTALAEEPSLYIPLDKWVAEEVEGNPDAWDRLRSIGSDLNKRLGFDKTTGEVVILSPEITPLVYENVSDPRVEPLINDYSEILARVEPYLKPGGMLNPFLQGHYDVTRTILRGLPQPLRFSEDAADIVADASRFPDWLEWNTPAAHAQTPMVKGTLGPQNEIAAMHAFFENQWKLLESARSSCNAHKYKVAQLYLGRALHGIEDLASHRGMTNAEHSYLDKQNQDPDVVQKNIDLANQLVYLFIWNIVHPLAQDCWDMLRKETTSTRWTIAEATRETGLERDFSGSAIEEYRALGIAMEEWAKSNGIQGKSLPSSMRASWFKEGQHDVIMSDLRDYVFCKTLRSTSGPQDTTIRLVASDGGLQLSGFRSSNCSKFPHEGDSR